LYNRLFPMPLAAVLLGTILQTKGHEVEVKDFLVPNQKSKCTAPESFKGNSAPPYIHYGLEMDECKKWLKKHAKDFDAVGLCMCQCNVYETANEIGKYISETLKKPLVIGGPHVTTNSQFLIDNTGANVAVTGEADMIVEDAFKEAIKIYKAKTKCKVMHGKSVMDLSKLPIPNWDLVDLSLYPSPFAGKRGVLSVSRGCPWLCEFCSVYQVFGRKMRRQSKERIKAELMNLWDRGVTFITFIDDNLFFSPSTCDDVLGTIEEIGREIPAFKKKVKFYNEEGLEIRMAARDGLIQRIKDAGFRWVTLGLETINTERQKQMKKPYTPKMLKTAIKNCRDAGVVPRLFYLLGFPKDTYQSICDDLVELAEIGFAVRPNNLQLYPSQTITETFLKKGYITKDYDWRLSSWFTPSSGTLTYKEIRKLRAVLGAIGKAAEEYDLNLIKDDLPTLKKKFKAKKYILTHTKKDGYKLEGNMFNAGTLKNILIVLTLRDGYAGCEMKTVDKKTIQAVAIDEPKNVIQKHLAISFKNNGTKEQTATKSILSNFIS